MNLIEAIRCKKYNLIREFSLQTDAQQFLAECFEKQWEQSEKCARSPLLCFG